MKNNDSTLSMPIEARFLKSDAEMDFDYISTVVMQMLGDCFFSVSALKQENVVCRIHSSHPELYPVGVKKSMVGTGWEQVIVSEKRHLFSPDAKALQFAFQDAKAIGALGFGCAINLCLIEKGKVLGSANLLAGPGEFTEETFERAISFVNPLTRLAARTHL